MVKLLSSRVTMPRPMPLDTTGGASLAPLSVVVYTVWKAEACETAIKAATATANLNICFIDMVGSCSWAIAVFHSHTLPA
jgi:hypothetical protein